MEAKWAKRRGEKLAYLAAIAQMGRGHMLLGVYNPFVGSRATEGVLLQRTLQRTLSRRAHLQTRAHGRTR